LNRPIAPATVAAVSQMDDAVVALLALDATSRGLAVSNGWPTWSPRMVNAELFGDMWLLAYEANVRNWLPNVGPDFVAADPFFGPLKAARVSFYNTTFPPPGPLHGGGGGGGGGLSP
jgi:hypothetical protein